MMEHLLGKVREFYEEMMAEITPQLTMQERMDTVQEEIRAKIDAYQERIGASMNAWQEGNMTFLQKTEACLEMKVLTSVEMANIEVHLEGS
jgi:tRNA nucleotidyltransferase (CCA-adding enzyme)